MSRIKIKVRPNQVVRFPGICVHCAQPAAASMPIRKRMGRVTREIDLPLCTACAHTLRRRSGAEERWHKIGLLLAGVVGLLVLSIGLLLTPAGWGLGLRFSMALLAGLAAGTAVFTLARARQTRVALPEKQTICSAARITTFSWRATTFDFRNDAFTERFKSLNESLLMES